MGGWTYGIMDEYESGRAMEEQTEGTIGRSVD